MFYRNYNQRGGLNRFFSFLFSGNVVSYLILINLFVYFISILNNLYDYLFNIKSAFQINLNAITFHLALPADLTQLSARPWTLLTSMFVHASFWHFLLNMLMLYFSGIIFLTALNKQKLWFAYIFGGLLGSVAFVLSYNYFPVFENIIDISYALGASAAIMGVLFTIASYSPNMSLRLLFFGQLQLKYLALIFVLIDLLSMTSSNQGGHIAHLGGALFGVSYGLLLKSKFKIRLGSLPKRKPCMKAKYNRTPISDEEYLNRKADDNKRIDAILDKISKGGYNSLSKEEKDFLFNQGKNKTSSFII